MDSLSIYFIFFILGVPIAFLITRELVTWYWKINEITANQKLTNELLKEQNKLLKANYKLLHEFVDSFMNK